MRPLSALLDLCLLPVSLVGDVLAPPFVRGTDKSFTRERIEKIEDELRP